MRKFLKRKAGVTLEGLLQRFRKKKIEYRILEQGGNKQYFRDTKIEVNAELKNLFYDYNIIPSFGGTIREFNENQGYIEINVVYNFLIPLTDKDEIKEDENHLLLTENFSNTLFLEKSGLPTKPPIERIRIYATK